MHSMSLLCMLKRSLGLYPTHALWNALPPFNRLVFQFEKCGSWEDIRAKLYKGWSIGDCPGPGRPVKGYDMINFQTVPYHIAGVSHCLAGRENCFQQSDRWAGHVGEGLHPHSVCLKVTQELLCKLNKPYRMLRVAFFF